GTPARQGILDARPDRHEEQNDQSRHDWAVTYTTARGNPSSHPPCGLCTSPLAETVYSRRGTGIRMATQLTLRHALLALAIVFVWGTNFVVIRLGLNALPPLFYAMLRFVFVIVPAILFLPRPKIAWTNLATYGLCIGLLQFGLLFTAMKGHISPGLASLVIQTQVFFTIGLAIWRTGEKIKPHQVGAFCLAIAGMTVIAAQGDHAATIPGLALV